VQLSNDKGEKHKAKKKTKKHIAVASGKQRNGIKYQIWQTPYQV
jgi:hypothetical protein